MNEQERAFVEVLRKDFSVVIIFNPQGGYSIFVIEDFRPYNPSNHQYYTELLGKDVTFMVKDYGVVLSDNMKVIKSIDTRISELPLVKNAYSSHYQYEWLRR